MLTNLGDISDIPGSKIYMDTHRHTCNVIMQFKPKQC